MQGSCFTRTGGTAHKDDAIRLGNDTDKIIEICSFQTELGKGNRFTGRQDTHDHILHAPLRRDRCHSKFDVQTAVFFKLDFAVLGLAAFGDIQIGHDLKTRHNGIAVLIRQRLVHLAGTVHPYPYLGVLFAGIGLDVDIGCAPVMGVDDNFVDQLNHGAVLFAQGRLGLFDLVVFSRKLGHNIIHGSHLFFIRSKETDIFQDVVFQAHIEGQLFACKERLD